MALGERVGVWMKGLHVADRQTEESLRYKGHSMNGLDKLMHFWEATVVKFKRMGYTVLRTAN